jgi:AAA15 family ATPase/GTPase
MIRELILNNFKAFGSEQRIPLKPITLIYGANSSGKSSILQALLLLKQTVEESADPRTSLLYKGSITDQQNYSRCIYGRDDRKSLTIGLGFGFDCSPEFQRAPFYQVFSSWRTLDPYFKLNSRTNKYIDDSINYIQHFNYSNYETNLNKIGISSNSENICTLVKIKDRSSILYDEYPDGTVSMSSLFLGLEFEHDVPGRIKDYEFFRVELQSLPNDLIRLGYDTFINNICSLFKVDNTGKLPFMANYNVDVFTSELLSYMGSLIFFVKNGEVVYYRSQNPSLSTPSCLSEDFENENIIDWKEYFKRTSEEGSARAIERFAPILFKSFENFYSFIGDYVIKSCGYNHPRLLNNIKYIGPLRKKPERYSDVVKDAYSTVGTDGKYATAILQNNPDILKRLNTWLTKLGINYYIDIQQLGSKDQIAFGDIHSLQIIEKNSGTPLTMCDVGFGISQILPILVQSLLPNSNTVLIEQPEIHLHPKMQAELGDFFIESALGKTNRKQFLLETHSEHLVLRIMRRMRATFNETLEDGILPVTPDDISLIYVQPTDSGSVIRVLELDAEGRLLDPWPGGFFEEGFKERFA